MAYLSIDNIVASAVAAAGVAEPDLAPFRGNLQLLVDSINSDANLMPEAVTGIEAYLAEPLRSRLQVSDWVRRYPEIREERIEDPLFVTGMPRSGTTYFQYLFDPEPNMRMLRYWEGQSPCPPPGFAPETVRPRIEYCAAEKARAMENELSAKLAQIHLSDADGPEECLKIMDQTFFDVGKFWTYRVPTYFQRCLDTVDMAEAYDHHKLVLQLLQWRTGPRRWVLKWPCHLVSLDAILQVYPDAKFIVTHRDPVQALASNCSLTEMLRRNTSTGVDNAEIGRQMEAMLRVYLERLVAFDERHGDRIAHVKYRTAVEYPEQAVAQAFDKLGIEMTPSFANAIVAWRANNPPGKRGTHSYSLDNYALDADEVAGHYAFYTDRFGIPSERTAIV